MSTRRRHPDKAIEAVLRYAESRGWRIVLGGAHRWGGLYCPETSRLGCKRSVWSTPRNPTAHARDLRAAVDACPHHQPEGEAL